MTADERFIYQPQDPDEEFGVRSEIITGPVSDWATDFSHLEPEWSADPYPIQDDLRQRCPIAHTDRFGGGWLPTRHEDGPRFREFVESVLEGINLPPEDRIERMEGLFNYLLEQVHDHLDHPRDDITSYLIGAEIFGQKLTAEHVTGAMALLLIAGIDTTWSAIGSSLWHLARNPADLARLVAEPGLLPTAMEEFLRAYAPVTMARLVKQDMHWHGVDMKAEDWILLSFPAANRDPAQFDPAGEGVIDREANRHAASGLGIHRCVGAHLASLALRVPLEVC